MILLGDIVVPDGVINILFDFDTCTIANLEAPVISPVEYPDRAKAGPTLYSHPLPDKFHGMIFCLANNHLMDYGEMGVVQTIKQCQLANILPVGAGTSLQKAKQAVIVQQHDKKIGIIARCETQFGVASPWRTGVASLDPTIYQDIRNLRSIVDVVIVSIHGAAEMCPWPSPKWQQLLRSFIDAGASIVHGHHAHVPQGYEEYQDGIIFYGLGNFLVAPENWQDQPNTLWSLVGECDIHNTPISYNVKTALIERKNNEIIVRLGTPEESRIHNTYLSKCNYPLRDLELLTGFWQEAAVKMYNQWYAEMLGFSMPSRLLTSKRIKNFFLRLRHFIGTRSLHSQCIAQQEQICKQQMLWYHLFACESHNDAISTALGVLSGELEDKRTKEISQIVNEMML